MIALPDSIINFGVIEGYSFRQMYAYVSDYFACLMKDVPRVCVYFSKFIELPEPTPFYYDEHIRERCLKKYGDDDKTVNGIQYKTNSVAYALAVIKDVGLEPKSFPYHTLTGPAGLRAVLIALNELDGENRSLEIEPWSFFTDEIIKINNHKFEAELSCLLQKQS